MNLDQLCAEAMKRINLAAAQHKFHLRGGRKL